MSELVTPDSNREKKKRTLLQFLSDHFQDIQTLREYLLQKQISKVNRENRSLTNIQERYGPYVAGALFVLKQGGAVKYGSSGDGVWERGRAPLLSNGCVVGALLLDFSLSFKRRR